MRRSHTTCRVLFSGLALFLLLPPGALQAQDLPLGPNRAEPLLDLSGLDRLDVEPRLGTLIYRATDLVVGEGPQRFAITRTYRPDAGDTYNMSLHWASALDHHFDVHPDGERAAFVDSDGKRVFFSKGDRGVFVSTSGPVARAVVKRDGFVLTGLGDGRTYRFDKNGWLLSRSDANLTLIYHYDANDRLQRVEGPWGDIQLKRNKLGFLVAIRTPTGRVARYHRDAELNLVKVSRETRYETYSYDSGSRLTSLANGKALLGYDATDRVIRIDGPGVIARAFRYRGSDGVWASSTHITQGERTTVVAVSRDGRTIERTTPEGLKTLTEIDDRGRPVKIVTADGLERRRTFDAKGRIKTTTGPKGLVRYAYGSKVTDRPTRITLEDGTWMQFTYDLRGRVVVVLNSSGAKTGFSYDEQGHMATKTDTRGAVTRYVRNRRGQLTQVSQDGVGVTRFLRDEQGRLTRLKQPDGRVVRVVEDENGRMTRISDGRGPTSEKSFDTRGRLVHYTDVFGRSFGYDWNEQGKLVAVKDTLGQMISFDYDGSGLLVGITDGDGNHTAIERDGSTVTVTDPTQGTRSTTRDAKGRVVEEVRGGEKTTYAYDAIGQLIERKTPAGVERFTYDAYGRLAEMEGPDGKLSMSFDKNGRLKTMNNPAIGKSISYTYSKAGDRTSLTMPWGTVNYRYDVQGRVRTIGLPNGGKIHLSHHPDGRRKEIRYPNGVVTTFGYVRTRLNLVVTKKGEQTLESRSYGYDTNGRVAWTAGTDGVKTHYTHDARGRLTVVRSEGETVTYRYDANGNRVQETRGDTVVNIEIAQGNQPVKRGEGDQSQTYSYTETGTLSASKDAQGTTRYVYDNDDQLVRVESPQGGVVTYGYAPNGTRLWRKDKSGKTHFLNDLADVVGEFDASGKLETSYVHGPDVDDVLSATKGDERFFYHYDLVRSVTAITGRDGRVAARYAYDAFGAQRSAQGDAVAWNPYRYTSRAFDADTGLYNYRARTYDPGQGRFTSADPVGIRGGVNLYSYAANDPLLFNDPFGFWPDWLDSAASWTLDRVDDVGSAIDTAVTFTGTKIDQGVTAAGEWAGQYLPEGVNNVARNSWAFTKGFGKGVYGATKGVVNMVRHPVDTYNGIKHAIENWDETWEAITYKWDEYKDAWANDPEKFWEMSGVLVAEIAFSVVGTKGIDKLAKAAKLGTVGRLTAAGTSRVSRAVAPIGNGARTVGGSLGRRFPRLANTVNRGRVLSRARNIELIRRASGTTARATVPLTLRTAPGIAGRMLVRTATTIPRRVARFGVDSWRYAKMLRQPGAAIVYTGLRMKAIFGGLIAQTGRGLWAVSKWGTIPVLIAFEDNITDAIKRSKTREAAMREVSRTGRALLNDAAGLTPEQLAVRVREVGEAYVTYRNILLKPLDDESKKLDRALDAVTEKVAAGEIPAETVDARVVAMFEEFGRRQQNLMTNIYDRNRDMDHDMFNPSVNRTITFEDEVDLLKAVKAKVTNPEGIALLDARIADLQATMAWEYDLSVRGDHATLIAGIAGPPRPVGDESYNEVYGFEGMELDDSDDITDSGDNPGGIYEGR